MNHEFNNLHRVNAGVQLIAQMPDATLGQQGSLHIGDLLLQAQELGFRGEQLPERIEPDGSDRIALDIA